MKDRAIKTSLLIVGATVLVCGLLLLIFLPNIKKPTYTPSPEVSSDGLKSAESFSTPLEYAVYLHDQGLFTMMLEQLAKIDEDSLSDADLGTYYKLYRDYYLLAGRDADAALISEALIPYDNAEKLQAIYGLTTYYDKSFEAGEARVAQLSAIFSDDQNMLFELYAGAAEAINLSSASESQKSSILAYSDLALSLASQPEEYRDINERYHEYYD